MDSLLLNSSLSTINFNLSKPTINSFNYCSSPFFKVYNFKKRKTSSISVSYSPHSDPQKPSSQWQNYSKPFSSLVPILRKIKSLAVKSSMNQWASVFRGCSDSDTILQNGGFGIALLSVTANAKVKISPFVATLAANPTFVSGFFAWMIAQSMKVFLHFCFEKKWDLRNENYVFFWRNAFFSYGIVYCFDGFGGFMSWSGRLVISGLFGIYFDSYV